jgi:tetratricopeptide (TPR) repeat protein
MCGAVIKRARRFTVGTTAAVSSVVALISLLSYGIPASAQAPHKTLCQGDSQPESLAVARALLEHNPSALNARLKLADVLIEQGCYQEAVSILEAGVTTYPHSTELQSRLRDARSLMSEQRYFVGLGNAEERAKRERNLLRCTQLADVSACDEALASSPDDPAVVIAKGDALLRANHPADGLLVYRRAAELNPESQEIKSKLATAESQRQALIARCENGSGTAAIEACQSALLPGAGDEFQIYKRKAILLQSIDRPEQALDSYIAANALKQDDKSVALAIVALTQSTGRQDAMALSALGSALLALGRATEALPVLRQTQSLSPTLPGIESQLKTAERLARVEVRAPTARPQPVAPPTAVASTRTTTPPIQTSAPAPRMTGVTAPAYSNDGQPGRTN